MLRNRVIAAARISVAAVSLASVGCVSPTTFFSEDFLTALGFGDTAANLPGEAPAIIIEMENRSGRTIEARVTWQGDGNESRERVFVVPDGEKFSEVVVCPVTRMTLGQLGDLSAAGAAVRLGDGSAGSPFIEVEPFGRVLEDQINYQCGDAVTFTIQPSSATLSGYQAFAYVRRSGAVLPGSSDGE